MIGKQLSSVRGKLVSLFVFILGASLVIAAGLGYRFLAEKQLADFDATLFNHAVDVASAIDKDYFGEMSAPLFTQPETNKIFPFSLRRSYIQIRDAKGQILARSENLENRSLPLLPEDRSVLFERGFSISTIEASQLPRAQNDTGYRLLNYIVEKKKFPRFILQVAAPMSFLELNNEKIRQFLFLIVPTILLLSTLGGWYLSQSAMEPVLLMIRKADQIEVGNLSERIPVPPTADEIRQLALTFNRLLERIERSVTANERFVADASHQLKTPLSILRGELDLMLRRPRTEEEMNAFLTSASQEINSLNRMVENLLTLARADSGTGNIHMKALRLDEVLIEVVSGLEAVAKAKGVRLLVNLTGTARPEVAPDFEMKGDFELLSTMFENLIENGIKYSPSGSSVEINATDDGSHLHVRIRDHGTGIVEEKIPLLFKRFYREPSAQATAKGHGLGLPIAASVAQAHSGSIRAESKPGEGTTFVVQLPRHTPASSLL